MASDKEFKRIAAGKGLDERPTLLAAAGKTLLYSFILTILLAFPLYYTLKLDYLTLFIVLLVLLAAHYADMRLKKPGKQGIYVAAIAKPKRNVWKSRGGQYTVAEEKEPYLAQAVPLAVDLQGYIHGKTNRNVLINGTSGSGKSKLSRHLLGGSGYQKVIFSFKPNDEYLKIGYPTADMSAMLPNPFTKTEAFISAFLVAFPLTTAGIQASLVPSTLEKLAKQSRNWRDFEEKVSKAYSGTKDNNARSALAFIQSNLPRLVYDTGEFSITKEDIVLDFSSLNENARNFYAELVLRQIYGDMEAGKRKDVLICVDEAHRLTDNRFGNYHTILVEMSREIRDKGMLWAATQNYTDIPDHIRSQFATQFVFKVTGKEDLVALRAIDPLLSWAVSSLPKHYFMDAQFPNIHTLIPAFYYNAKGETDAIATTKVKATEQEGQTSTLEVLRPPSDRPTPTMHAALLAIAENKVTTLITLAKWLKKSGFVTGDPTIYGYKGRKGVFDNVVSLGYAKKTGKNYELTEKGKKLAEPEAMLGDEEDLGSDLHRQLLKKTIEYLHKKNMLVFSEVGGFDLIAYPVDAKKKYLWDDVKRRAFEIQTTARKDSVMANAEKKKKYGLPITWVSYDAKVLEEIKKLTDNRDEYMLIMA
jgi:hypothetical protein